MARKIKYFGGRHYHNKVGQCRAIVAAESKKVAAELMHMSLYEFNQFWSQTGNKIEVALLEQVGPYFPMYEIGDFKRIYKPLEPRPLWYSAKELDKMSTVAIERQLQATLAFCDESDMRKKHNKDYHDLLVNILNNRKTEL